MDNIMLAISVISMLAGVISAYVAVRAKKESEKILNEIKEINIYHGINSNCDSVNVSGENSGIVAKEIHGEVKNNG